MDGNVALAIYRDQYDIPNEHIERIRKMFIAERTAGANNGVLYNNDPYHGRQDS